MYVDKRGTKKGATIDFDRCRHETVDREFPSLTLTFILSMLIDLKSSFVVIELLILTPLKESLKRRSRILKYFSICLTRKKHLA